LDNVNFSNKTPQCGIFFFVSFSYRTGSNITATRKWQPIFIRNTTKGIHEKYFPSVRKKIKTKQSLLGKVNANEKTSIPGT